ncbi:sensor histidine kinase [Comamonas composti]|uniref:sensor histidine kinase n=1 Tax=Comamonas composti TaxID=408558 RepID=UPI0004020401|nr:ATP-binding protein [Comamonas composti]
MSPPQAGNKAPRSAARLGDSLRLRLVAGTLAWVLLAVLVAGWGLRGLFREHVTQQLQAQLMLQLDLLSASVNSLPGARIELGAEPTNPQLSQPLSGLYWQIDRLNEDDSTAQAGLLRSRSLWDQTLDWSRFEHQSFKEGRATGTQLASGSIGPARDQALVLVARRLQLPEDDAPPLRIMVAADSALMAEPLQRFTKMLAAALGTLAAGLMVAVLLQLRLALRPLEQLRRSLADVRGGASPRLQGRFPQELEPLVQEFNHVLDVNADMVERARTQAGNLAHAVNTPLTILGNAAARDNGALAELVREQVASASRQVDHHLARARAAARQATGLRTPIEPPLAALVRTMGKLHAGRGIAFSLQGQALDWSFLGDAQDLQEILGNLLDNAGKWARHEVRLSADPGPEHGQLQITVDDDGPGIPADQQERIFARGQRLDERRPGAGLGLDIVRDLVQTYGGSVQAGDSPLGGLQMRVHLPGNPNTP